MPTLPPVYKKQLAQAVVPLYNKRTTFTKKAKQTREETAQRIR